MQRIGPLNGSLQPACPTVTSGSNYGLTECNWAVSYTLTVPTTWTTGNYIVKLHRMDDGLENYMTFVVRDDAGQADIVYSMDVTTWQAYNFWGGSGNKDVGYTLYGSINDVTYANLSGGRAYAVSFDRPYLDQGAQDGAGNFMVWDYPMVRWAESQGYNLTYVTDIDLESNPNVLNGRKVFMNTGHDEYYSDNMRAAIQRGIAAGVNLAFFSANNIYDCIIFYNSASGQPYRRVYCDKGALPGSTTFTWRDLTPPQPENAIVGVMQNGVASARPYLVYDATSWLYTGTGLVNYTGGTPVTSGVGQNAIAGLIGYEFDERAVNASSLSTFASYEPAGLRQVGHSAVPASDNGVAAFSDATLYTAASGATVFAAGTIQWSFGLDNGFNDGFCDCNPGYANTASQKITHNILDRFTTPTTAPAVTLSPSSLDFGSQNVGTTSAAQTVTLTNTGSANLSITSVGLSGANAGDFAKTSDSCTGATVSPGASCAVGVTFTPASGGSRAASLSVVDNAANSPQNVGLSGVGLGPSVTLSPTSLSFGNQLVATTSVAQSVTLTNSGNAPLTITGITIGGTNPGDFALTNTCPLSPTTLASSATCSISVTFTPAAAGTRAATVQVADDAPGSPQSIPVSGTGTTPAPAVSLSPTTVSFGNQNVGTTSAAQTVTLTNTGSASLSITAVAISGTNAGDFAKTSDSCSGSTVAVNATCTVSVTFSPSAGGSRSAALTFSDNAPDSQQSAVLSGTGGAAAVSLSPTSLNFGSQSVLAASSAQSVTLTNSGNAPLTISGIAVSGTNASDFAQTNTCGSSVAAGASCAISVTFTPQDAGARSAALVLTDSAAGSPQQVALSGTGQTADVRVGVSANKTTAKAGTNVVYTITVTNSGPGSAPGITLTDAVPAGTTFVKASWSSASVTCTAPAAGATGNLTCAPNNAGGSLASGASFSVTMTVAVSQGASGTITDTATVAIPSTLHYDPNLANNSASVTATVR